MLLVLALALSLGLAASSWARGGMGRGPGGMNLTPEQAGKIFDLKEKMHADTAGLRKQMMVKHAELAALWKAEKPDQKPIQAKQKELNALRDQMQEKRTAFRLEAKKIAPNARLWPRLGMVWAMVVAWAREGMGPLRHGPRRWYGSRWRYRPRWRYGPRPRQRHVNRHLPPNPNPGAGLHGSAPFLFAVLLRLI